MPKKIKPASKKAFGYKSSEAAGQPLDPILPPEKAQKLREQALAKDEEAFSRGVLDSLPAHLCVLDGQGTIIAVNKAWAEFARQNNGDPATERGVGANYIQVCEGAAQRGDESARAALDGIRAVMSGAREVFDMEYPCHAPKEQRWFVMRARPMSGENGNIVISHQIITERKLADLARQRSETMYREVVENASDLIYTMDLRGYFKHVNAAGVQTSGYALEELQASSYLDLILPEYRRTVQEVYLRQFARKLPSSYVEFPFYTKAGEVRWLGQSASPIFEDQKVVGYHVIARDITERRQAETIARQRANELNAVYEAGRALYQLHTPQTLAHEIIDIVENVLNYTHCAVLLIEDTTGKLIPFALSVLPQKLDPPEEDLLYVLSREPRLGRGITGWVAQHGESARSGDVQNDPRYYGIRQDVHSELCVPLRAAEQIIGVINIESTKPDAYTEFDQRVLEIVASQIAVAIQNSRLYEQAQQELAERKQAQEAVTASEKRFRALIENSADAITLLDPEGVVVYDSPAAAGMLGYEPDEWIRRNIFEALHPNDQAQARVIFKSVLEKPLNRASHLLRARHKDGSWRWLELVATNLLDEPAVGAVIVNYGDITERRRAQTASNLMQATALAIAESSDFNSALDAALRTLCEATGWRYAEAWIPRPDKSALELGAVWYGRGEQVEKFREASRKFIFQRGEGLPGRVWTKKAPEWIPDVSVNGDLFRRAPQALEAGLKAGMGIPIIGNGQVLVVAFFMFEARPEDRAMMETAMAVGNQLGTMLLRKRAEEDNKRKTEDLLMIQSLNNAANRGDTVGQIFELLKEETAKIFSPRGTAFYRVSEDGERLEMAVLNIPTDLMNRIEKMIGMKLPKLGVTLREGSLYREILLEGNPRLIEDLESIQQLMAEFTDNPALKKMVGAISAILGDHSVMSVPMISEGIPIGLLEVSRSEPFTEADLQRMAVISGEVTAILQRKRAEESLRYSEEKYRSLTDTLPIGISVTTPEGGIIEANPALVKMSGYDSKEEFMRAPAVVHYHNPQDRQRYIAQLLEHGAISGFELQLQQKDGSVFWASASSVTQKHPDGSVTLVHSIVDITESKRRLVEMETLLKVSQIVTQTSELDPLLQSLLDAVVDALPAAEKGTILLSDEAGSLHIRAMNGYHDKRILGSSFPSTSGYSARSYRLREPLLIPDARAKADILYEGEIKEMGTVQSAVVAPLIAQDRVIGVIAMDNTSRKDAFTQNDLHLLTAIASSVALSIQNARLLEETRLRLARIESLRNIDMAISSSTDLRVTFNVVLDEVVNQLGIDAACLLRLDRFTQTLDYAAGRGFRTHAIEKSTLRLGEGHAGRAALERNSLHIADLPATGADFVRANLLIGEEFKTYYAIPMIAKGHVLGVLELFHRAPFERDSEWMQFLEILAGQAAIAIDNTGLFHELEHSNINLLQAYDATIEGWSQAMDMRDKETEGHVQRVTKLTERLAHTVNMDHEEIIHARRGALLHDIGKIGVPDSILLKAGALTSEERAIMGKHPILAYNMLAPIAYLKPALDIPYCHHEKWDGTGYPRGLKGEQIPLVARLFAMADVYDALTSDRPYREKWSKAKALEYIREQSGKHFDPSLVNIFLSVVENDEKDAL